MLHPSYIDLMQIVNNNIPEGEQPIISSRYSLVLATAKRAKQIIKGARPLVKNAGNKPLSIAVEEVFEGKVKILAKEEELEDLEEYGDYRDSEEFGESGGMDESEGFLKPMEPEAGGALEEPVEPEVGEALEEPVEPEAGEALEEPNEKPRD